MSTTDKNERQILPFATALQQVEKGAASNRASRLLNELVNAVAETGRKGTLTLTITVAPYKKSSRNLDVTVRTIASLPEGDDATQSGVFFHDADGNLSREDPQQATLPLRGLPGKDEQTA